MPLVSFFLEDACGIAKIIAVFKSIFTFVTLSAAKGLDSSVATLPQIRMTGKEIIMGNYYKSRIKMNYQTDKLTMEAKG
jgi:hypothetical protein